MKKLLSVIISLFVWASVSAQQLTVSEFKADPSDMAAVVHQVSDLNGNPCALIKVGLAYDGATFEGDIIKTEKKGNEYWVYVIEGANWLNVMVPDYVPLRYEFDGVQKNTTYVMQVVEDEGQLGERFTVELTPSAGGVKIGNRQTKQKQPVKFDMILVKSGVFKMGATPEQEGADDDEKPVRWITLTKDYYIGETEVTQELWEFVMGNNPANFREAGHPVENISWEEAQEFVSRLSNLTGAKFRLPTEAEWENAARGGHKTQHFVYSGSNDPDEVAWHYGNSHSRTQPVKSKAPNELGIYDMSGNVFELCQDYKQNYDKNDKTDPLCTKQSKNRVRRGGAWDSDNTTKLRNAFRRRVEEKDKSHNTGLRVVMEVE